MFNTEPTTQTSELPPEVFAELLSKSLEVPYHSQRGEIARLAYAAGAKAGAKDEYQRGADAELDAICEWLREERYSGVAIDLRTARRPELMNEKAQALAYVARIQAGGMVAPSPAAMATIIRALESLPDAD